jgi:hypothetical protein
VTLHLERSLKNQILLKNYYLLGELEQRIARSVSYYNVQRYHENPDNVAPAHRFHSGPRRTSIRKERRSDED